MAAIDIMKEYLVSLGFAVDKPTYNESQQAVKGMEKSVSDFTNNATKSFEKTGSSALKNFATAQTAVASFFVAANVGIAKYISGLAEADLKNEMFARKMWMNKDNAIAYKNSLSALGADIQDLYLSPELLQKFNQLRQQAFQIGPPEEYADQMKNVRAVTFEFQRMKLEAAYAMQWIGYYLYKYLEKPITEVKEKLADFNDKLTLNMPQWTKQVAQFVSWFVRLGEAGVWGIQQIWHALDQLSPKTKAAGGVMLGFFALLETGPIGWMIAGLTALLLLLDDYKTYQEGGKSLFADQWEKLDEFKKSLEDNGTFDDFKTSLDEISESLGNILKDFGDISEALAKGLGFKDFTDLLTTSTNRALKDTSDFLKTIAGALDTIDSILSGDKSIGEKLNNFAEGLVDNSSLNPLKGFEDKGSWQYKLAKSKYGEETADKMVELYRKDWENMKGIRQSTSDRFKGLFGGGGDINQWLKDNVRDPLVKAFFGLVKEWSKLPDTSGTLTESALNTVSKLMNMSDHTDGTNAESGTLTESAINTVLKLLGITKHADGGIQTTPHLGWVAEKYPESIIPLDPSKRQNALNLLNQTAGLMGVPMSSTTVQNITNVNFTNTSQYKIYGSEPTATARAIDRNQPDYGLMLRNFRGAY